MYQSVINVKDRSAEMFLKFHFVLPDFDQTLTVKFPVK